jgi:hypothetical protein
MFSRSHDNSCSGVKSVQAEAFAAVSAEERSLSRNVSDAAQMVASIESGTYPGGDRDPLDCDSMSDGDEGGLNHRPSAGSSRTRPKTSGQTELPIEVSCLRVSCHALVTRHHLHSRFTLSINFCEKQVA